MALHAALLRRICATVSALSCEAEKEITGTASHGTIGTPVVPVVGV